MNPWLLAGLLTVALLVGFASGWWTCSGLGIRSPNAWITTLILLGGSLGAPVAAYHLLGPNPASHSIAVFLAGFATGATFWPMAMPQGKQEWL